MAADFKKAFEDWRDNARPRRTNPAIEDLSITSDGFLIAQLSGSKARQSSSGAFLGRANDFLTQARKDEIHKRGQDWSRY